MLPLPSRQAWGRANEKDLGGERARARDGWLRLCAGAGVGQDLSQIQCETYDAVKKIDSVYPTLDFDKWSVQVEIFPTQSVDGQLNVGLTHKPVTKSSNYFQWALGGSGAASGGSGLESFGSASAKNDYAFRVLNLFEPLKNKNGIVRVNGNAVMPLPGSPHYHEINSNLRNLCSLDGHTSAPLDAVPAMADAEGYFGIEKFLRRSIAGLLISEDVEQTGQPKSATAEISQLVFSKEYRSKIWLGVTPGWYVATGNFSPGIGGYRQIDDYVTLTFKPPSVPAGETKIAQPIKVILVDSTGKPIAFNTALPEKAAGQPATDHPASPQAKAAKPVRPTNGLIVNSPLSTSEMLELQNSTNSLSIIQQLKNQ